MDAAVISPRVKRRKLEKNVSTQNEDDKCARIVHNRLVRNQNRISERRASLKLQKMQFSRDWSRARSLVIRKYDALKSNALRCIDDGRQKSILKLQALERQLDEDAKILLDLRHQLRTAKHLQKQIHHLQNSCYRSPLTLNIRPHVSFQGHRFTLKMTEMRVVSLTEVIGEFGHRCFSSVDIARLVQSYVNTRPEFTGQRSTKYKGHGYFFHIRCVAGLSDGRVASIDNGGEIHVWDPWDGTKLMEFGGSGCGGHVMVSVGGNRLLTASSSWINETLQLWDLDSKNHHIRKFKGHVKAVTSACTFPDSNGVLRIASGSEDGTIRIWDLEKGTTVKTLRCFGKEVWSVSTTVDGRLLVSGSDVARVWDTQTGECLRVFKANNRFADVKSVIVLGDQKRVVSLGGVCGYLYVWDIETCGCLRVLQTNSIINRVSMFSDGRHVVSVDWRGIDVRVWDTESGECIKRINIDSCVSQMCCLNDDRIVSTSRRLSDVVRIWE